MQLANQEARRFNHEFLGTDHVLIGLVKEGAGVAATVLKNIDPGIMAKIMDEVEKIIHPGDMNAAINTGKLPHTNQTNDVVKYAIEEADGLSHKYVGTEHILLGLIRETDGAAAKVLAALGLTADKIRGEVMSLLGHDEPEEPVEACWLTIYPKENPDIGYKLPAADWECVCKFQRHWSHLLPELTPLLERLSVLKSEGLTHGDLVQMCAGVCHPVLASKIRSVGELMAEVDRLSAAWMFSNPRDKK